MKTIEGAWFPIALLAGACRPLSEEVRDPSAGMNGGFEEVQSGLPVNWLVYSPATIPTGSYELLFDDADFKEGQQSLRFHVRECSAEGGWRSPGLTREFPAEPGTTYAVRFWVKTEGCDWKVTIGGVTAMTGEYETLRSSETPAGAWHHVEREYTVKPEYDRLRFELSITSPGDVWIDDVRVDPIVAEGGARD